ncbi:hypothetical protein Pfo_003428 [Paulownia fortunei]|nr:hypothetical protein Pfo_003428 [Paulownia fortunei]
MLVEENNANILFKRDIIVHTYSSHGHRIKYYYRCYDPLQIEKFLYGGGKCKYHYPRSYCESTIQGKDEYAIYKKRKNRLTVQVVPYNLYLLSRYNLTIVKYLYKHIYRGHDRVTIHAPWVFAQEVLWIIFEFNLNEIFSTVINLQFYILNQHCVTYLVNQNLKNILKWDHVFKIMRIEDFSMCSKSENARKYFYREFPEHYIWGKQDKCWKEIKKKRLFLWEEAPMTKLWVIEHIDKLLKDVMGNKEDFGGKVIVLVEIIDKYYQSFIEKQSIKLFPQVFLHKNTQLAHYMTSRAILAAKNEHVDSLNNKLIFMFLGEVRIFNNFDETIDDTNDYFQEQTISNVGIYLSHSIFSHDQLYVALSKKPSISTTKVLIKLSTVSIRGNILTKNIMYK